ncbi:DsrE family protein [Erythrobacter insulae]|uniref:DsrE family protein n=1 Tax=Erythrobacter insulae TaxID=2584124 RepID=A0A547PC78_9SPHN|nr:DsrE family protein [Erythrobacter insulae]TRD11741.1 DsrE family protein [Erythrobacter insulae]
MKTMKFILAMISVCAAPLAAQQADMSAFKTGPVFEEFGPHAPVEGVESFPDGTEFAVAFDVAKKADDGARNRGFESAARFINMHVAAGVDAEDIRIVVVVHGTAVLDLITDKARGAREMGPNASAAMVSEMLEKGVLFVICGQSASVYQVKREHLIDGVDMDLSAMTVHAELQQQGYTLNPF